MSDLITSSWPEFGILKVTTRMTPGVQESRTVSLTADWESIGDSIGLRSECLRRFRISEVQSRMFIEIPDGRSKKILADIYVVERILDC